jgi:sulfate adenylyltransferase subunit 1 (EFTu-like GTPase family)
VYRINGNEVLMGKVENGILKVGDTFHLLPYRKKIKIKKIVKFLSSPTKVSKGEAVGLKVIPQLKVERGAILCSPSVNIRWKKKFKGMIFVFNEEGVFVKEKLQLECSLQKVEFWIKKIIRKINPFTLEMKTGKNFSKLNNLEGGEVEIEVSSPIGVEKFKEIPTVGRFIINKNKEIIGIGVVI